MSSNNPDGYAGKLLRVDLTSTRITEEHIDEDVLRKYIGGVGLGAKFLYEEVPPNIECCDAENRLIFATGPLAGTRIPGSGTFSVSTKGCLTGGATSSQANGFFGAYLKFAGFDGIIIQGAADKPVYLYLHDGKAELRDAGHLAGKDTHETDELIKEELGYTKRGMSVACIGPAGESLVKYAAIVADKGHIAGHNGTGAVMGSKRLKAIAAARGKGKVPVKDPDKISALAKKILESVKSELPFLYKYGTLGTYQRSEPLGHLPIKNYTTNIYPDPAKLYQFSPEYILGRFQPKPDPCWACRMHHCHEITITEGPYKGLVMQEPEYECFSAMGSQIGNMEVASAMMLTDVVDRLGFEMNETGWVMGLAIECYEKGLINDKDTDGIKLTWGNVEAVKSMLRKIAHRQGFGDILAEGVMRAAQRIGGEAPNFAVHIKQGNTPRGYDYRAFWTEGFDVITSNTSTLESRGGGRGLPPADLYEPDMIASIIASGKGRFAFVDSLGICSMATHTDLETIAEAVSAATGWDFTADEAEAVGLRAVNLMRAYNFRCGHTRELEAPSPRSGSTPVNGPAEGKSIIPVLDQMLDLYYEQMGWDKETGKPLPDTLKKLGLEHIIKDIW